MYENLDQYYNAYYNNKYWKNTEKLVFLIIEFLSKKQKKKLRILDDGCGIGCFSDRIIRDLPKHIEKVVGIDIEDWVDKKLKNNKKFEFIKTDATNSGLKSSSFDIIFSHDVIEHIENDQGFIKECSRLLKEDGICIIITPNIKRFTLLLLKIFSRKAVKFPKAASIESVNDKEIKHIHIREYDQNSFKKKVETYFPSIYWFPIFVGIKVPWLNFIGSYNLKINRIPFLAQHTNHLFVVCSKNSQTINDLSSFIYP